MALVFGIRPADGVFYVVCEDGRYASLTGVSFPCGEERVFSKISPEDRLVIGAAIFAA